MELMEVDVSNAPNLSDDACPAAVVCSVYILKNTEELQCFGELLQWGKTLRIPAL